MEIVTSAASLKRPIFLRLFLIAILAAIAVFAFVYASAVGPYWKVTPDSTTYVRGAQALAEGNGYQEDGSPAVLFPPGTSAILAVAWILGGKSYWALNAEVVLFTLGSLAISFLLFRKGLGDLGGAVVVLLCLASTAFFDTSTFLLSEIFFVFFSLTAFLCYGRGSTVGAVGSALLAVMVRTVGVTVAAALIVDSLRKRPRPWKTVALYSIPLFFAVFWELRNRTVGGWSYALLMTQREPWDSSSGHVTIYAMLARLVGNLAYGSALETLMTNGLLPAHVSWAFLPRVILGALLILGAWRLWISGKSAVVIYVLFYGTAIALYWSSVVERFLVPVLPIAFACFVGGIEEIAQRIGRKWVYASMAILAGYYLTTGFHIERSSAAEERESPFPKEAIKYPFNYDLESIALWWKDQTTGSDLYACRQPNILGAITGRHGVHYKWTGNATALSETLRLQESRFLFLDMNISADRYLASVLRQSDKFRLLKQQPHAQLFELNY